MLRKHHRVSALSVGVEGSNEGLQGHTKDFNIEMVVVAACLAIRMKLEPRNITC